eukprot:SAG11_NODE_2300_length_3551_cov_1.734067_3_plen_189_part_01
MTHLDFPSFNIQDQKGLALVMQVYRTACSDPFPVEFVCEPWKNKSGQAALLRLALTAPPDVFSFSSGRQIEPLQGLQSNSKLSREAQSNAAATWGCISLLDALMRLAETEHLGVIRPLFDFPMKHCPEVLTAALVQTRPVWSTLKQDLLGSLMPPYLLSHPNSSIVVQRVWSRDQQTVIRAMLDAFRKD